LSEGNTFSITEKQQSRIMEVLGLSSLIFPLWGGSTQNQAMGWAQWCTSVVPATQEVEVGGLWSEATLGKRTRPYMKNKLKTKELGA
jgi:hypothetical protein